MGEREKERERGREREREREWERDVAAKHWPCRTLEEAEREFNQVCTEWMECCQEPWACLHKLACLACFNLFNLALAPYLVPGL